MIERKPTGKGTFRLAVLTFAIMAMCLSAGCSKRTTAEPGQEQVKRSYTRGQIMTITATERNRYQNVYTSQIWGVTDKVTGQDFEATLLNQIHQFFKELGTMNLLADEQGIELTGQEKDALKRLSEQYYGLLSQEDREYIGADQEEIYQLYCEYYRADKLVSELTKDENMEISDAEAKVIQIQRITLADRESADSVLAEVQAEGANFETIAKKYSKDAQLNVQLERGVHDGPMAEAAFSLEQDETSGVIEDGGAFYIVKCINAYDEEATAARKKKLAMEKKTAAFQSIYGPFADQHVVVFEEGMWDGISFDGGDGSATTNFFELFHSYFSK